MEFRYCECRFSEFVVDLGAEKTVRSPENRPPHKGGTRYPEEGESPHPIPLDSLFFCGSCTNKVP